MQLFSIQPRWVYDQLAAGRPFAPQPRRQPDHWLNDPDGSTLHAYEWLCQQCEARGLRRPGPDHYPVWAWYQWAGPKRRRPDLRTTSLKSWAQNERQVLLTLEVPDALVLLHDYDAWHACLNYWYLGSASRGNDFHRRCKAQGLSAYRTRPLPDSRLHDELVQTWQLIFDLSAARKAIGARLRDQVVQASFWAIEPSQVRQAIEFGQGQPLRRLTTPVSTGTAAD